MDCSIQSTTPTPTDIRAATSPSATKTTSTTAATTTTKVPCHNCSLGQVCDLSTKRCRESECVYVNKPENGKILGNGRGIGDIIRYKCDNGYTEKNRRNVVARCLENGKWNTTVQCVKVCGKPSIENAIITGTGTIEGSLKTVTCKDQTKIDVNTVTSIIECKADGSWSPETTCSKFNSVIFKVVTGNGKSAISAWRDGSESTSDKACRTISNTNCTNHYRDPRIDKWDALSIRKVRYSINKDATEVAWVEFNGTGSNKMNWFQKERLIGSSYKDLVSSPRTNYFALVPNVRQRYFYASVLFNTCEGDKLWFGTIEGDAVCWYEQKPIPSIIYSTLETMATSKSGAREIDFADTAVVTINN